RRRVRFSRRDRRGFRRTSLRWRLCPCGLRGEARGRRDRRGRRCYRGRGKRIGGRGRVRRGGGSFRRSRRRRLPPFLRKKGSRWGARSGLSGGKRGERMLTWKRRTAQASQVERFS